MKIKIGLDDCLRKKTDDTEISFLSLLEDDQYFNKKIRKLKKIFKLVSLSRKGVRMYSSFPKELIDLNMYSGGDEYLKDVGLFCMEYKNCPFEMIYSVRSLIENGYWIPVSHWEWKPVDIIVGEKIEIDVFNKSDIFIQISRDIGITKLKEYLEKEYKKISDYFEKIDPTYRYALKGINQPNININKKVFNLRNQKPPIKYSEIAKLINKEYSNANYNESNLRNTYKAYLKSIRNLRK